MHKLLILLAVPKIQELHSNLKILLTELQLDSLDFVITSDIKMILLMLGLAVTHVRIVRMGHPGTPLAN